MPRVVITGASGFVGSHLADHFIAQGAEVHALGRSATVPWRLADAAKTGKLVWHGGVDIADYATLQRLFTTCNADFLVHAAAYGVNAQRQDRLESVRTNVLGTTAVLEAATQAKFRRILVLGTALELQPALEPLTEQAPLAPGSLYGVTKAAGFLLADMYRKQHGLPLTYLRLFTTYGPREESDKLIPYIIRSFQSGGSPTLKNPNQVRDLLYVADVAAAIGKIIYASQTIPGVLHLGSGFALTIGQIAEQIASVLHRSYSDSSAPEMGYAANPQKICQHGWSPAISLAQGIQMTANWYEQNGAYNK